MQPNEGIKAWQWIVTVIVIIVLIVLGYYLFKGGSSPAAPTDETMASTTDTSGTAINRLVVTDQYPGNIVYVQSVQLAAPGWVVIYNDNAGTPGAIIGESYFPAGINPGKITLTAKTVDGGTYYAMLASDNGDQQFDATKDLPLKDINGNPIMQTFHASNTVTEVKG